MDNIISFMNVSKKIGDTSVLENVSFTVNKGDVYGYIGPNGAGKTTSIRLMLGLLVPDKGDIKLFGMTPNNDSRKRIGFCFDDDGLYSDLSCMENLILFKKIYNTDIDLDALLDIAELKGQENKKIATFSRGMKKRLGVVRALICNPELLILDEPFIGLDPEGQDDFKKLLLSMSKSCTILISSHDLFNLESLCNRITILNRSILHTEEVASILSKNESLHKFYVTFMNSHKKDSRNQKT